MIHPAAFPYAIGSGGQTLTADADAYLEQLIIQILFVEPGERVNRPAFGCSLRLLVFSSGASAINTAAEAVAQTALRQWAGDAIRIHAVDLAIDGTRITVSVRFLDVATQRARQVTVTR